jgi:bleomycin hydrolase
MLSTIETEHIMKGDSVHLSPAWVEHMMERDSLMPSSPRAVGMTLIHLIERHGLVPYQSMPSTDYLPPRWAFMLGAQYTPLEFAHSVCAPGEYIGIGHSDQYPDYAYYVMESPDNWERNELLNLPADTLLEVVVRAVRQHHGICWEGDTSERGFDWPSGLARLSFLNGSTTDDHCMAIVGLARDEHDEPYFILKNSWGTNQPHEGLVYMPVRQLWHDVAAIYLTHDAWEGK